MIEYVKKIFSRPTKNQLMIKDVITLSMYIDKLSAFMAKNSKNYYCFKRPTLHFTYYKEGDCYGVEEKPSKKIGTVLHAEFARVLSNKKSRQD